MKKKRLKTLMKKTSLIVAGLCVVIFLVCSCINGVADSSAQGNYNYEHPKIDFVGPSVKLWPNDTSQCSQYETRSLASNCMRQYAVERDLLPSKLGIMPNYKKSSTVFNLILVIGIFGYELPLTWLVSFPCSGNTWLRYMIEATTGIFTGSMYADVELYKAGYLGELEDWKSGRTIVQKSHSTSVLYKRLYVDPLERDHILDPEVPLILIIRNPVEALVSYWKFISASRDRHLAEASNSSYRTEAFNESDLRRFLEFHEYVLKASSRWWELTQDVLLTSLGPLLIVHYEDLKKDPVNQLKRVLQFIKIPVEKGRLNCLLKHQKGQFLRNTNSTIDPLVYEEKKRFRHLIGRIDLLLQVFKQTPLPEYPDLWPPDD